MKQPFFTIGIPACNVAAYIGDLIASLKRQSFGDFEALIVVEDSTDGTLAAARSAAGEDGRFVISTHARTGSPSNSRNYAVDNAAGRYLLLPDGDDWLAADTLERFAGVLERNGECDVVVACGRQYILGGDAGDEWRAESLIAPVVSWRGVVMTGVDFIRKLGANRMAFCSSVCLNCYSVEFLRRSGVRFLVGMTLGEDTVYVTRLFLKAEKVTAADFEFYCYRRRPMSLTTGSDGLLPALNREMDELMKIFEAGIVPDELKEFFASQWLGLFVWYHFNPFYKRRFTPAEKQEAFDALLGEPEQFRRFARVMRHGRAIKRLLLGLLYLRRFAGFRPLAELLIGRVYFRIVA